MKISLGNFADFFKSAFGCTPEEMIGEFKPFCEYDWKERTLTLVTKDCSQLLELHQEENLNRGYLELIYDNHNEKELIGFIIHIHPMASNLFSCNSLVLNLYFYRALNDTHLMDLSKSNWRISSYTLLESLLRNARLDIKLKKKLYHLIGMVDGVEHKNYED